MLLIELVVVLLIVFVLTAPGQTIYHTYGLVPLMIVCGIIGGTIFWFVNFGARWVVNQMFGGTGRFGRLSTRRHILGRYLPKTKIEARVDAMDDETLQKWVEKNPREPTGVEALCERLKKGGDLEGYARQREYFLKLDARLSVEEKCHFYNELADLYFGPLEQHESGRAALDALIKEFPREYQASLARERLKNVEKWREES